MLEADDGDDIEVEWEIQEEDNCDESLDCHYGTCATATGVCDCDSGWTGKFCNVTTNSTVVVEDDDGDYTSTPAPSYDDNNSTSQYDQLVALSVTLQEKADSGQMDTGYTVTAMLVVEPEDVCGVAGGNGTSCLDDCGVANGDGTSCISTTAPTAAAYGDFSVCENATSNAGASERQQIWIKSSNFDNSSGFFGTFKLSFNGYSTDSISVYASTSDIETRLLKLASVRDSVSVTGLLEGYAVSNTSRETNGVTQLRFGVEFPDTPDKSESVQNLGSLPLIEVDTFSLTGDVKASTVNAVCLGKYRTGYEYAEQRVTITTINSLQDLAAAGGSVTLELDAAGSSSCGNGTSDTLSPTATPAEVAEALYALGEGMFGGTLEGRVEVFQNASNASVSWTVRFYTLKAEDLTGCTNNGELRGMRAFPNDAFRNAGARVAVDVIVSGIVPTSAMPIDLTLESATSGAVEAFEEDELTEAALDSVAALVVVCGDGVYMSAEGCDDGNTVDGDGCAYQCDKNCTVESGYVCTKEISYTSVCTVPLEATIQFQTTTYNGIPEGNSTTVYIERLGDNTTACNVSYTTVDSDAKHSAAKNNDYTPGGVAADAGDYEFVNGTLNFAPGETVKSITLHVLEDGCYDGAADETFVLRLESTTCVFIDDALSLNAYIEIDDDDIAPTPQPTQSPSSYPTTHEPSVVPTSFPSEECAGSGTFRLHSQAANNMTYEVHNLSSSTLVVSAELIGTGVKWICLTDACYMLNVTHVSDSGASWLFGDGTRAATFTGTGIIEFCVQNGEMNDFPTPAPSMSPVPTKIPTSQPSVNPTGFPSVQPTEHPTESPTATPTLLPTSGPSAQPTAQPTEPPSGAPTNPPTSAPTTSLPSAAPTAIPSMVPTSFPSIDCGTHDIYKIVVEPTSTPVLYTIYNRTTESAAPVALIASGSESSVRYVCLGPQCYVLTLSADSSASVSISSSIDSFVAPVPTSAYYFCTSNTSEFYSLPTATPSVSPVPSASPTSIPTRFPTEKPSSAPSSCPTTGEPSALPTGDPTAVPSAAPSTPVPSTTPSAYPSPDCDVGLYRYDTNAAGAHFEIFNVTNQTEGSLVAVGMLNDAGYVCLSDGCYVLNMTGRKEISGILTFLSLRDDAFHVEVPVRNEQFCTANSTFVGLPTPAPTITGIPTAAPSTAPLSKPTVNPTTVSPSPAPSMALPSETPIPPPSEAPTTNEPSSAPTLPLPTFKHAPTGAPTSTSTAVILKTSLGMTSEYNATAILASSMRKQALASAMSSSSDYLRSDGVEVADVADTGRRRLNLDRALAASHGITVDFSMTVYPAAYGIDDHESLVQTVVSNISSFVNNGGMTTAVSDAATSLGVSFTATVPSQTVTANYTVTTVVTPDWFPTANPTTRPTLGPTVSTNPTNTPSEPAQEKKKKAGDSMGSLWILIVIIIALGACAGASALTYGALRLLSGASNRLSNTKIAVTCASYEVSQPQEEAVDKNTKLVSDQQRPLKRDNRLSSFSKLPKNFKPDDAEIEATQQAVASMAKEDVNKLVAVERSSRESEMECCADAKSETANRIQEEAEYEHTRELLRKRGTEGSATKNTWNLPPIDRGTRA